MASIASYRGRIGLLLGIGTQMASFGDFKASERGAKIGALLSEHDWQVEMVCLAKHGLPPAQAVGAEILARIGPLDDTEKQHVGRWIRDILAEKGWRIGARGARVAPGNLFSRASLYVRRDVGAQS